MAGKNSQIHLFMETSLKRELVKEAIQEGISVSELCRKKLREGSRLLRIESLLLEIKSSIKRK